MPTYELTSPKTGRTYDVEFDRDPSETDLDEAVGFFDQQFYDQEGLDPSIAEQGPLGTIVNKVRNVGPDLVGGLMSGGGRILDAAAEGVARLTGTERGGLFADVAAAGETLIEEGERLRPTNPANETAGTIGSGVQQALGLVGTMGLAAPLVGAKTAVTTLPLVVGGIRGGGEGVRTAQDLGIDNPAGQLATGAGFAAAEILTERLGGVGGKAAAEAIQRGVVQAGKTILSEAIEEPLAGAAQEGITRVAGEAVADPARPGYTITGAPLPTLEGFAGRRVQEAIGGAAGGLVFAGIGAALQPQPGTAAAPAAGPPGLEEDLGELTAAEVADLEPAPASVPNGTFAPVAPAGVVLPTAAAVEAGPAVAARGIIPETGAAPAARGAESVEAAAPAPPAGAAAAPAGAPARTRAPAFRDDPLAAPAPVGSGNLLADFGVAKSPQAQAVANQAELNRQRQIASLRAQQAQTGNRMPVIPDSPLGGRDILDFVNENPLRIPRKGSEEAGQAENDWRETWDIPMYYRKFLARADRGRNPADLAQQAFDEGYLREPTPDALMEEIQSVIRARTQYRVEFRKREKALQQEAKQVTQFEKSQAKPDDKTLVALEDVVPGDEMTIDGEPATVKRIDYDEDGYLTNVVIEDGKRFGVLSLDPQTRAGVFVDEWQPRPRATQPAADAFVPEDPFALESLSAVEIEAEKQRAKTRAELAARQERQLKGDAGEFGTADLLDPTAGPMALFNQPAPRPGLDAARLPEIPAGNPQDSASGLFEYAAADETQLREDVRDALGSLRREYPGAAVVQLLGPGPSPDGPRAGDSRNRAASEWSTAFERLFSKRVVFVQAPTALAGANPRNQRNVLLVNVNSGEPLLYVLGHELAHAIQAQAPNLHAALKAEILSRAADLSPYRAQLRALGYADGEMNDEIVADFIGNQMVEPGFLNELAASRPTLFQRFAQAVLRFLDSLRSRRAKLSRDVRPYFDRELDALRARLATALKAYAAAGSFPDNPLTESPGVELSVTAPRAAGRPETRSRFARPQEAERWYQTRADVTVQATAAAWLDGLSLAQAAAAFEQGALPAGMTADVQQQAVGQLLQRAAARMDQGTDLERLEARSVARRMSRVWQGYLSQEAGRALRQRAVVNAELVPIAPVLAAENLLIDRADAVMDKRFDGGAAGAAGRVEGIAAVAGAEAGTTLAAQLNTEMANPVPQPAPPRKAGAQSGQSPNQRPSLKEMLDALRKKIAPGMTWEAIFTDMPSTQKARQREMYRRLLLDERLATLTQAERLALTNELDRVWQTERRRVFQRYLQKDKIMGEKLRSDRLKVEKALPKLLRLINLGMMNSELFREAVAPQYGLRQITSEEARKLRELAEQAWNLPEGVLRNRKMGELLAGIQKAAGASWAELLNHYWVAAVLSGLRTMFDTFVSLTNGFGTSLILQSMLLARGQGAAALGAHLQWWQGLGQGMVESLSILRDGDYAYLKRFNEDLKHALNGEGTFRPVPLGEALLREGNLWTRFPAAVMVWTGRMMAAADHINNTATTYGAQAVARALHPEIYNGAHAWTAQERLDARKQALREVTGGAEPGTLQERATVQKRTREILTGQLRPEEVEEANFIGDQAAYQNDPIGLLGGLYQMMNTGLSLGERQLQAAADRIGIDGPAGAYTRATLLFVAGALRSMAGVKFMRFGANFGNDVLSYVPGTYLLSRSGQSLGAIRRTRIQNDLLLGKNVVGLLLGASLAALFADKDDEEDGLHLEGSWADLTPEEKAQRRAAGLEALSMWWREGGKVKRVSYKSWPTGGIFAAVGAIADERRFRPDRYAERGTAGHLLNAAAAGAFMVKDINALSKLAQIFGESATQSDPEASVAQRLRKLPVDFAGGLVPTAIKDLDTLRDPRSYRPEGVLEELARNVPVLRSTAAGGRPTLNRLGEEIRLNRLPWSRAYTSVESGEAHRVLGALLARGLNLPAASTEKHIVHNGTRVSIKSLGAEAEWRYAKAVGTLYREWLAADGNALLALPDAQAERMIRRRSEIIKRQAAAALLAR